jgi:hypothetical protein
MLYNFKNHLDAECFSIIKTELKMISA